MEHAIKSVDLLPFTVSYLMHWLMETHPEHDQRQDFLRKKKAIEYVLRNDSRFANKERYFLDCLHIEAKNFVRNHHDYGGIFVVSDSKSEILSGFENRVDVVPSPYLEHIALVEDIVANKHISNRAIAYISNVFEEESHLQMAVSVSMIGDSYIDNAVDLEYKCIDSSKLLSTCDCHKLDGIYGGVTKMDFRDGSDIQNENKDVIDSKYERFIVLCYYVSGHMNAPKLNDLGVQSAFVQNNVSRKKLHKILLGNTFYGQGSALNIYKERHKFYNENWCNNVDVKSNVTSYVCNKNLSRSKLHSILMGRPSDREDIENPVQKIAKSSNKLCMVRQS